MAGGSLRVSHQARLRSENLSQKINKFKSYPWHNLYHTVESIMKGNQDRNSRYRNLEAGTEARDHGGTLLPGLVLSYTTQDHLAGSGTAHSGLDPPTPIINQENVHIHAH